VPDGVLFGSSKAHTALRTMLVKDNQLEAVISLPSGVFKPYAGVSTAILVFTKGGKTDHVFFYDIEADGFSLDDKRDPITENDLPDAFACWRKKSAKKDTDRTSKYFMIPVKEIEEKDYDLSINRYKEAKHEEIKYDPPKKIIAKLRTLEAAIAIDLSELERML
jgi:type I restriction enzyme M protein